MGLTFLNLISLVTPSIVFLKTFGPPADQRKAAQGKAYRHQGGLYGVKMREMSGRETLVAAQFCQSYSIYKPVVQFPQALLSCCHGINLVYTWLLIVHIRCCLMVQLILPYINSLFYIRISIMVILTVLPFFTTTVVCVSPHW